MLQSGSAASCSYMAASAAVSAVTNRSSLSYAMVGALRNPSSLSAAVTKRSSVLATMVKKVGGKAANPEFSVLFLAR